MGWFTSRLSPQERKTGRELIAHLQRMVAYQQLSMERYNDAVAGAAGMSALTDEGLRRPLAALTDTEAVRARVVPALRVKGEILQEMQKHHGRFTRPTSSQLRSAYDDFSYYLSILRDRADLQLKGFSAFLDPSASVPDTTQLDAAERDAMNRAMKNLNELIASVGIDDNAWMELNCEEFNAVRKAVGLGPLRLQDFQSIYIGGQEGKPARFFDHPDNAIRGYGRG